MVARLFGMEVANASLYDGSTALAEAALMAARLRAGRRTVVVSAAAPTVALCRKRSTPTPPPF